MSGVIRPDFEVVKEGRISQDDLSFYFFLRSLGINHLLPSFFSYNTQKLPQKQPKLTW
jgi:hypothetical protein